MSADPSRLRALIESVADGESVDWQALEASPDGSRHRLLRHLRLVARVADVHRTTLDGLDAAATDLPDVMREAPGVGRWGHLVLLEKIGEGSFGEVFRARDPWLDREVALKLLRTDVANRVSPHRIVSEARALARLRHHNVVTVYGADIHHGRVGLWMELVRGRTLSQILAAQGSFSASEAAVIGQDICRALSAVHAAGLVHQDVKAHNVMRESGGRLVLMDFGAGGTPLYLAPEVLAGKGATIRSDIYAVGVLLFQLVSGRYPVTGTSVDDLENAHARQARLKLADARTDLPDPFVAVVERAVHPQPSERFATANDMRDALANVVANLRTVTPIDLIPAPPKKLLRWTIAIPAALLLAASLLVGSIAWRERAVVPADGRKLVAVLPFRPIGSDEASLFYSQGLSEDLTVQLASLASVQVVSGVSTRRYRDSDASPSEIGRELQVDRFISGSVRVAGDHLRIVVELVDTRTAKQLWGRLFEGPKRDVVQIQSDMTRQIASALKGTLTPEDTSRLQRPGIEPRAFELYLQGRYYWSTRGEESLRRSIAAFNDAIAIDPTAALPYAGLADTYMLMAFYNFERPAVAHVLAEQAALQAIRLDPNLAQVHAAMGSLRLTQFRWGEAEASLQRAIDLNPSYPSAHHWYAMWLLQQHRFEAALTSMQTARALDPFSHVLRAATAYVFYASRDFDRALREHQQVLQVDPAFSISHRGIIETLAARRAFPEALAAVEEARRVIKDDLSLPAAYVYALAGRRDESQRQLQQVEARLDTAPASCAEIASVYGALGDMPRAFEWLARAVDEGDTQLGYLGVDPRFDPLRGDARFAALLASLGISNR